MCLRLKEVAEGQRSLEDKNTPPIRVEVRQQKAECEGYRMRLDPRCCVAVMLDTPVICGPCHPALNSYAQFTRSGSAESTYEVKVELGML